jgi:hypothetical protein
MSTSPTFDSRRDASNLRRRIAPLAIATVVVALAFNALGVYGDGGGVEDGSTGKFLIPGALIVVAVAIVFGFVVPRQLGKERSGTSALVMSVLAALLVLPVFWAGFPAVLGAGGAFLGWSGRRASTGSGTSQAAFALGLLAVVAWIAIYVLDWMSTNNIV